MPFERTEGERLSALLDEMNEKYERKLAFRHTYRIKSAYELVNVSKEDHSIPATSNREFNIIQSKICGYLRNINFLLKAQTIRIITEDKFEIQELVQKLK